jgi:regulation of enolase protein 1 (concanavalin A-like superfamily)
VCALVLLPGRALAQTSTASGAVTAYSTIYSLGVEWDITGDTNHDARVDVEYKSAASAAWLPASPLIRVDYNGRNMLAGSVMFLSPDTAYQVRLTLFDPDGGGESREVSVRTRKLPAPPAGRVFHVVPGAGGGDGSLASPFGGVDAAQAIAQPGDTFLMHAGFYGPGRSTFWMPGAADAYIAWKAAGDGEVTLAGLDVINSGHVWFEGLAVRDQMYGLRTDGAPTDVVLIRCAFINNFYNVYLNGGGSAWYIADNTIYGATPYLSQSDEGEGIELAGTSGHTIAHNSITNVADGVSTPRTNVDMFGNDIFNTADDGLELDFGLANVRAWQNRIHNAYHNGISFQPQNSGPWYIIRNQIVGSSEAPLKFRTTDRFVLLNNTIVNYSGDLICCSASHLLRGVVRNNLWISARGGQLWNLVGFKDWRTDIDYDGFDWGDATYPLVWNDSISYDVPSFARASGLEAHGIRIFKDQCFADFRVPGPTPTEIPPHLMTLRGDCNAVDAGAEVANLGGPFAGAAPDLGAYEFGLPAPAYGPRPVGSAPVVALTAPVDGASFSAPANITLQASASADQGIAQIDFFANGEYVGSADGGSASFVWSGAGGGTYALMARAVDSTGAASLSTPVTIVVGTAGSSPPPSDWADGDIGSVSRQGSATVSGDTWTMTASGSDVWGTADAFHFAYRTLTGNGRITARVSGVSATDVWTKAGVMMREDLGAGSRQAFMLVTPGATKGLAFQRRLTPGGESTHTSGAQAAPPLWVRLIRSGTLITAQYSADGVSWTTVGSEAIPMAGTIYVGLALTSHNDAQLASATFDSVSIETSDAASSSPIPSPWPWDSRDVGAPRAAGAAAVSSGAWTISGSGADIWGNADAFQFVSRPLTGDGTIVARVTMLSGDNVWAKAGVMLRETADPGSPHAFALVTPGGANGVAFQRRLFWSGVSDHTGGPAVGAPVWVKLVRRGALVSAYWSLDGQNWWGIGADTIQMASTIYAGLAVTSHDAGAIATAVFDNVSVTSDRAWTSQDIGAVNPSGWTSTSGDQWSLAASGADIWGTADAFRFSYQTVSGNFDVRARVTGVDAVDQWTKAGVMVRASADASSAHASMFATPGVVKGTAFQRREWWGAESVHTPGPALAPAVWVRLSRQGNVVTAWYSVGDAWILVGSDTIDLPETVLVGIAVTSHQEGALATGTFDNVTITPSP